MRSLIGRRQPCLGRLLIQIGLLLAARCDESCLHYCNPAEISVHNFQGRSSPPLTLSVTPLNNQSLPSLKLPLVLVAGACQSLNSSPLFDHTPPLPAHSCETADSKRLPFPRAAGIVVKTKMVSAHL